jgi:hypothetical protein
MTRIVLGWMSALVVGLGMVVVVGCGNPSTEPPPESESVTTDDLDIELPEFDSGSGDAMEGDEAAESEEPAEPSEEASESDAEEGAGEDSNSEEKPS